ncbi:hypothetical protein pb186bvf_008457 [Paramecium bursaria]
MTIIFLITFLRITKQLQVVADQEIQAVNLQDIVPNYQRTLQYNITNIFNISDKPKFAQIYQNRKLLEIQDINVEGISQVKGVICQQTGFFRNIYYLVYKNQLFESKSFQGAKMNSFTKISDLEGVTDCYDIDFIYNQDQYQILIDCSSRNENNDLENKFIIYYNGQQTLYDSNNQKSYTIVTKRKIFYDQFYNRIYRIYLKNYHDASKNSVVEIYQQEVGFFYSLGSLEFGGIYGGYFNQRLFILANNIRIFETSLEKILINSKIIEISNCQQFDLWPEFDKLVCIGYSVLTFTSISEQIIQKEISIQYSKDLDYEVFVLKDFIVARVDKQIIIADTEQYQILAWSHTYGDIPHIVVEKQLNEMIIFTNSSIERYLLLRNQYLEIYNKDALQEKQVWMINSQTQQTQVQIQLANYESHSIFYDDKSFFNNFIFLQKQTIDVNRKFYGPSLNFSIEKTSIFEELKYKQQNQIYGFPQNSLIQNKMVLDDKQDGFNQYFYYIQQLQDMSVYYYRCDLDPINYDFNQMCGQRIQMNNFKYVINSMWYQDYSFKIIIKQEKSFNVIKYSQNTSSIQTISEQLDVPIKQLINVKGKIYVLTTSGLLGYSSQSNYTQLLFNFTRIDFERINVSFNDTQLLISKNPSEYFFLQSDRFLYQFYRVSTKLICTSRIAISSINTKIQVYALQNMFILFSLFQNGFINAIVYRNYEYLGIDEQGILPLYGLQATDYDLWPEQNNKFILISNYSNIQTISQYDMSRILYSSLVQKFDLDYLQQFHYLHNLLCYHRFNEYILVEFVDQPQLITNMTLVQQQISNVNLTIYTTLMQPSTTMTINEKVFVVNSQLDIISSVRKLKIQNTECVKLDGKYFNGTASQYKAISNHRIKYQFQPYLEKKVNISIQDVQNYKNSEVFILLGQQLASINTGNFIFQNYSIDISTEQMILMTILDPFIFVLYQNKTNFQYYTNIYRLNQNYLEDYIKGIITINKPTDIQQILIYVLITNKTQIQILTLFGSIGQSNFYQEKCYVFLLQQNLYTISLFQNQLIIHRFDFNFEDSILFQILEQLRFDINQIASQFNIYIPAGYKVINMQFVNLDTSKETIYIYTIRLVLVYEQGLHDLIIDIEFEQQIQFDKLSLRTIELIDLIAPFGDWEKQKIGLTANYLYIEYFDPYTKVSQLSFYKYPNQTKQSGKAMQPFTNYWAQFQNKNNKLIEVNDILYFTRNDEKSVELYKMLDGSYACPNDDNSKIIIFAYNYISSGILKFNVEIDRGAPWIWIDVSIIGFLIVAGLSIVLYKYIKNRQQNQPEMLM